MNATPIRRIIIEVQEDCATDEQAVQMVLNVIRYGRISKSKAGEQYCFATRFQQPPCMVFAIRRNDTKSERFVVQDSKHQEQR